MRSLIAILVVCMLANTLFAQCGDGTCQVPTKAPVLQAIAAPVVSVLEAQPVRKTIAATIKFVAVTPQVVRQAKPVRSLATISVKVLRAKPVRSAVRRIFCR